LNSPQLHQSTNKRARSNNPPLKRNTPRSREESPLLAQAAKKEIVKDKNP